MGYYYNGRWRPDWDEFRFALVVSVIIAVYVGFTYSLFRDVPYTVTVQQGDKVQTYQAIGKPDGGGTHIRLKDGKTVVVKGDEIEFHPTKPEAK